MRKITKENALISVNPTLSQEWHPHKNEDLTPKDVSYGSQKKVWWICKEGHEWEYTIKLRHKGSVCPICASIVSTHPTLLLEWHPSKNISLTPETVTEGSGRKVWWICKEGHEWEATVNNRTRKGSGCPYCKGKKVTTDNCLAIKNPDIIKEWHPTRNTLTPYDVTLKSHTYVWWRCKKGHEWQASPANRSRTNCPYCAGKKVSLDNCLATLNPSLAEEWHPMKNTRTPFEFTVNSLVKAWWLCKKGHEWESPIVYRNNRNGCPICNEGTQTSFPEQTLFYYFKKIFNESENRYIFTFKQNKIEFDLFIPSLMLAVEYDGYYHEDKVKEDEQKNKLAQEVGIQLIRIRAHTLPELNSYGSVVYVHKSKSYESLKECLLRTASLIMGTYQIPVHTQKDLQNLSGISIELDRFDILDQFNKRELRTSLMAVNPEVSKDWHPLKNGYLIPEQIRPNSDMKVWWMCQKGHEWEAVVKDRNKGRPCPYCSGRKVCLDNCLATIHPKLASQWHKEKNKLTPWEVYHNYSGSKFWWVCEKGHEWEATIRTRTKGHGCGYCARNLISYDKSILATSSDLVQIFHPVKNTVAPSELAPTSQRRIWWMCDQGHEWEEEVIKQAKRKTCLFCFQDEKTTSI
ncbi:zinc-ribbon domain-containing protein [Peribacillus simplex]|nr:zinc-ribbon domain-containing protein [Peribacillus simplex]